MIRRGRVDSLARLEAELRRLEEAIARSKEAAQQARKDVAADDDR